MDDWIAHRVVAPARQLIEATAVGDEILDLDRLNGPDGLCIGVEGVLRRLIGSQYEPWPVDATTDGVNPDICWRTGPTRLEIVGMCYIDFAGEKFPVRVRVKLTGDLCDLDELTVDIGNVDESGFPPRLSPSAFILPEREDDARNPRPLLVLQRRPQPIAWTSALSIGGAEIADSSAADC